MTIPSPAELLFMAIAAALIVTPILACIDAHRRRARAAASAASVVWAAVFLAFAIGNMAYGVLVARARPTPASVAFVALIGYWLYAAVDANRRARAKDVTR